MFLSEYEWSIILLSLKIGGVAIAASLPVGILFAWILARKNFKGKSILDSFINLPLVLPPVVIGYLLLITMGKNGYVGKWIDQVFGISFSFNWKGAALASAVVSFPLLVQAIRISFESIDRNLEFAARSLGASRLKMFFTVTLPLSMPGIIAGVVLAFARSLGEFGATITFVSNIPGETRTLPLAMYTLIQTPNQEAETMRLCIIAIGISFVALILSEALQRAHKKRLGLA
ncbi:molybdate ABC transporter permease subunit [Ignatzschineria cameli]|uniref:Molybdenum transport system permease n=1 Tax=Ignatzschineria cameli TaxID=2182793 RepID=A0A2U2ASE9_9GAMM|nr:molybdate ABC transporter permease subunit [Ignatzschineria cameli]PWD87196.1 molybdate ABC transporter permease subunit [Ignatzschineria cameli]PWD92170.1 molybdate ABC transporter permease subunit [Ignatzschineria cameli]PWD93245.1 molybdate ABC transporter permease subunit [Ignatzschineria cameli]PWD93987.1 molybdate ABC transporter permease subunit [Ignatzschineria cameli]